MKSFSFLYMKFYFNLAMWKKFWKYFFTGTWENMFLNYLHILAIGGGAIGGGGLTIAIFLATPYYDVRFKEQSKTKMISDKFSEDDLFLRYLSHKSIEILKPEQRMNFRPNEPTLTVVVGESGIGKTTEICHYAKELREAGHPVLYYTVEENPKNNDFLYKIFGTSDTDMIMNSLEENFTKKNIFPTLIIDNIHHAVIDGKIDEGLLTFLNGKLYQGLDMQIIMLSSVNGAAYEMDNCKFVLNFIFLIFKL